MRLALRGAGDSGVRLHRQLSCNPRPWAKGLAASRVQHPPSGNRSASSRDYSTPLTRYYYPMPTMRRTSRPAITSTYTAGSRVNAESVSQAWLIGSGNGIGAISPGAMLM